MSAPLPLWMKPASPEETGSEPEGTAASQEQRPRRNPLRWLGRLFWRGKPAEAFWTVAALLSITLNVILIVVLVFLARYAFALKAVVEDQLLAGLATNFQKMDAAVIRTTVVVEDTIPVQFDLPVAFDLPIETETVVVLTEPVFIPNATVTSLVTGGLEIRNAPASIVLPEGVALPVRLRLVVPVRVTIPVDTRIPVRLEVPVAIPLSETELHEPFVGLQQVVAPYQKLLGDLPDSWNEALCSPPTNRLLCALAVLLEGPPPTPPTPAAEGTPTPTAP